MKNLTIENTPGSKYGTMYVDHAGNDEIMPGRRFRNFRGDNTLAYNQDGKRFFNFRLYDPAIINDLRDMGANIRSWTPVNDEGEEDEPIFFIRVEIAYGGKNPPKIYLVNKEHDENPVELRLDQIAEIDSMRIDWADFRIGLYHSNPEKTTFYLNNAYIKIQVDPITARYGRYSENELTEELPFD